MPIAKDVKIFVPAEDFSLSLAYYQALGWKLNWQVPGLAELELGGNRFFLQNYYQKDWAHNFMFYIVVENAQEWYDHIAKVIAENKDFSTTRVNPPKEESHAIVTYAWDPCGVLIHFAEQN